MHENNTVLHYTIRLHGLGGRPAGPTPARIVQRTPGSPGDRPSRRFGGGERLGAGHAPQRGVRGAAPPGKFLFFFPASCSSLKRYLSSELHHACVVHKTYALRLRVRSISQSNEVCIPFFTSVRSVRQCMYVCMYFAGLTLNNSHMNAPLGSFQIEMRLTVV